MWDLIVSSWGKLVATAVIGGLLLFSKDIYLFFARRDFDNVNIQLARFTRNDLGADPRRAGAIEFRTIGARIPLREIYRNRFLVWRVIIASIGVTLDNPILNFGGHAERMLAPVRDRTAVIYANNEIKRALGFPFKEARYQVAIAFDRSEDRRSYILRVVVIREDDLVQFQRYLDKPPRNSDNFALIQKIEQAYREKSGSFTKVQIVGA